MEVRVRQISVVICAYTEKRWDDLNAAVDSVIKQSHPASDIVLVIDHNPALFERAQKAFAHLSTERTKVVITQNTQLRGLSGARNTGIEQSCGDIVAFIDEDAMAAPDWLARMSAAYDDPNIMAAGGSIAPLWLTGKPSWFPDEFNWVVGCTYRGMPESRTPIRNLIGCNMSVRREVFDAVPSLHDPKSAALIAKLCAMGLSKPYVQAMPTRTRLRALVDLRRHEEATQERCLGRLEALLARHWPELGGCLNVREQKTALRLLAELGGPVRVATNAGAARDLLGKSSRGQFGADLIDAVVTSARTTLGVPMFREHIQLVRRRLDHLPEAAPGAGG